ncbi:late embryogenesis abundant protein D-34-like [Syzygium oleosum]|uniref:late embryogenesis abundant protein D-34-like n=1 Tax=Syzygium oleosum TaxID=219896 RepID=UPI0011D19DE4|nr:late embryogenesis abundant protein D-34-like [Syzygium oleosum]
MVYHQLEIRPLLDFVQVKIFDLDGGLITFRNHRSARIIGEALEATAQSAGDKPVDQSDAAAILMAEQCKAGSDLVIPGGLAASAQTAVAYNEGKLGDEAKIKISDILALPADRPANREDAKWVANAELRTWAKTAAQPGGVAASVAAAVRLEVSITNP